MTPRVALTTYSTKPRGGVVHTLALAEALHRVGLPVTVVALGDPDRDVGFYRPVQAPYTLVAAPPPAPTLEERVFAAVDALAAGLEDLNGEFDIVHTQDCISGRAGARARAAGAGYLLLRTVHHVDDFTTPALLDCQRQAILQPDRLLVVSEFWRRQLALDYGVDATVVHNGVDPSRFGPVAPEARRALRERVGAPDGRFLILAVGGIEPRKGSVHLLEALSFLKHRMEPSPVLAVVGGHSFQDYTAYRDAALGRLPALDLELGTDVVLVGTVGDEELTAWYRAADVLAYPSLKEGWGLVTLEAMSADLPVVASDIPVFREYLTDGIDALLVPAGDPVALASALWAVAGDAALRDRLRAGGRVVVDRFTWEASAERHLEIYAQLTGQDGCEKVNPIRATHQ